ncbi:MAG: AMP-dependent synthetase/ligase [Actinomycetaceae bacterium]|nr:AMP-dependent synthetase/ligase [Actinomycetaceae bacterium]MDY5855288.1 AMP-dependent synthetase/ligase [Arcanobacterium sp.]
MSEFLNEEGVAFRPGKVSVSDDLSVPGLIRRLGEQTPRRTAMQRKLDFSGTWADVSWAQLISEIRAVARGLIAWGVQPGDAIGIMAHTSYQWALFDLAIQFAGGLAVPIYETDSTSQAEWIIQDAQIRAVVAENAQIASVLEPILKKRNKFEQIWVLSDDGEEKIIAQGNPSLDVEIDRRIDAMKADSLWTIIYTSGTTGQPKGVELTHRNVLHVVMNGPTDDELMKIIAGKGSRTLLFLPMAHVFARFINLVMLYAGRVIGHSPDTKNLVADMQSFKPTFVLAVPRVFEKIYNAADAKAGKGIALRTFRTFAKVAIKYSRALDTPEGPSKKLIAQHALGERLVYSKIKEITGGKLRASISGGAPLGERLGSFFRGIGMPVYEGYGLTETSAPTCVNTPDSLRIGSVGVAYPGCYMKVADDGELLVRGDHVFHRYHNNKKATAEAFTVDGWFRTGDMGRIDDDDFIWITGRKKELIVTAGGKNVAPAQLEDRLRGHPIISQVVVVGDQKPFVAAMITLDAESLPRWLENHDLPPMSVAEAVKDPQVIAAIDRAVKRTNEHVSRAESIRKFELLATDFTIGNGYLTPSLKVKRAKVLEDFSSVIEKIYGE